MRTSSRQQRVGNRVARTAYFAQPYMDVSFGVVPAGNVDTPDPQQSSFGRVPILCPAPPTVIPSASISLRKPIARHIKVATTLPATPAATAAKLSLTDACMTRVRSSKTFARLRRAILFRKADCFAGAKVVASRPSHVGPLSVER